MATNPDNWWESAPVVAPANDPTFSGYIPGIPKVKDPPAPKTSWTTLAPAEAQKLGLDTGFTWQRSSEGEVKKVGDAGDPGKDQLGGAIKGLGLDELLTNVSHARSTMDSGTATGITGSLLSHVPGTNARDFRSYISAIQGGVILEKLQALKEASKTGASGMGALSEKEGERLAASVAALDPGMSDEALQKSLREIEQHANTLRAVADGKDPRDPAVAKQYGLTGIPTTTTTGAGGEGGPPPPGVSSLDDNQRKAYDAFLAANPMPSGDAVGAFLTKLTGKTVTNGDEIAKGIAQGKGVSTTVDNKTLADKVSARVAQMKAAGDGAGTALGVGAADALTLGTADEINAFGRSVGGAFRGEGSFGDLWDVNSTANKAMEQSLQHDHPLAYTVGQVGGGLALAPLGGVPAGEGVGALAAYGAKSGAAFGGAYGLGSGEGANRITDAATGAVTGGAIGALAPYAGKFVADKVGALRAARGLAPDLADAAKAEGVDLIKPMVDPSKINEYGALESNVYSQPIIRGAAARVKGQIEDRVQALGQGGTALEPGAAGEQLQVAGNRYIARSRGIANRLYRRAENLAGDTRFVPQKALEQVDNEIGQLSGNAGTNSAEINFLKTIRDDLAQPGGKTVAEIRNIREGLRGEIGRSNLTFSSAEARALRVLDAATGDISTASPQAASAFKRADSFYRGRQVMVDDLKRAIMGKRDDPLDPQKAFANIQTLMGQSGNARRLSAVMSHLEPNERQDIAATVAESLGRRSTDEPFSTALFLSQSRKLSPAAQRTLFGADGAKSVENLRLLSQKLEEAGKDINHSRSATVLERQGLRTAARTLISGLAGIGGTAVGGVGGGAAGLGVAGAAMGASAARRVLSARAMVNPRVSMWLAQSADVSTPQQAKQAVKGLTLVISREPALAQELTPIRDFLDQRVTQLLAANPDSQDKKQN